MVAVVPCPVLVGRAAELNALVAALDAACGGRGGLVFLVGEAGIGKSRLVHEISTTAAQRGLPVLRGRAVPGSSTVAFRPLAEALAALDADLVRLGEEVRPWLPALAGLVPAVTATGAELTAPVRGEAVLRLLRSLWTPRGGVLVLEDLHWADPETVAIVEHLSDHLDRAPALCVATLRPEEPGPGRDLVRRVAARRSGRVVSLNRLNTAQVSAMVYACAGATAAAEVDRVVGLCDGLPFLVEELLVAPGLPASLADSVEARLAALPDPDRRVLVTAAAFGRHFDWRLIGAATALADAAVADALERGVRAQLLAVDGDGFVFRHALTAEAVFQSVIPPRRGVLASEALAALDRAHPDLPDALRDTAARLAERAGALDRAGRLFLASGEDALAHGALHTAVVALERAADLLAPGAIWDRAGERLIEALALIGRVDDARAAGEAMVDRLPPAAAAAVHLRLAGAAVTAARWDMAAEQIAAARPQVEAGDDTSALAAGLALREGELAIGTGEGALAAARASTALELARDNRTPEVECAAMLLLGRCARRSSLETAAQWFRRALATAELHGLALWRLRALHEVGTIALLDRSDVDELLDAQSLAESLGAMATAAILDVEVAAGLAGRHDLDGQRRHGLEAVRRGAELGLELVVAYGWQHVAVVAALRGDGEELASAAASARAAAPGNRDIEGLLAAGTELIPALLANDLERALAAAERCAGLLRGSPTAPPMHLLPGWPLLLALGHRPEALAAVEEVERAGVSVNQACRGGLTMARAFIAGRTDPVRAAALAVEADTQLTCVPWWRHVVRRLAASAAATDGWAIPDDWMVESEHWLRGHGYSDLADVCSALRQHRPSSVPPAWAGFGITPREADVLGLVIEGHANREIAEQLHLSVRTVEKHVESLLRKTGTRTRTQLARVAATT